MGMLPQVLKIIFEVQRKMNNEKKKINKLSNLQKKKFLFGPLLLSNLITF
jgi:hypothetical protein